MRQSRFGLLTTALGALLVFGGGPKVGPHLPSQLETVETEPSYRWVSFGHAEGHLALRDSPAGAFSPDSSRLAVASGDKVLLQSLGGSGAASVLHPRVALVKDFEIRSANFLAPTRLLILGNGLVETKKGMPPRTPELAFLWDTATDKLSGKVNSLGAEGGTGPAHYFPIIRRIGMAKGSTFDVWNPLDWRGGRVTVPPLTQPVNLYSFSPDGHWLLLAQFATSSQPNPVVVRLSEHQFVDSLGGHLGAVLSMEFSRDNKKVVTACEDGKVRVFSVPDWKLVETKVAGFRWRRPDGARLVGRQRKAPPDAPRAPRAGAQRSILSRRPLHRRVHRENRPDLAAPALSVCSSRMIG